MGPEYASNYQHLKKISTKAARFVAQNCTQIPGITARIQQQIHVDVLNTGRQEHRFTLMYKLQTTTLNIDKKKEYLDNINTHNTRNQHKKQTNIPYKYRLLQIHLFLTYDKRLAQVSPTHY